MTEPALKLAERDTAGIKTLAGTLAAGLTANPLLVTTPKVPPADLIAAAQDVTDQENVLAAIDANRITQNNILTGLINTLKDKVTISAKDSTAAVEGDAANMEKLNIPIKKAGSPTPAPAGGPKNFSMTQGDHLGEADGHCDAVKGSSLYRTEYATTPAGPWTVGYEGKKSRFTIRELPSGTELWFRMSAFAGGRWSDPSDPATCRIP